MYKPKYFRLEELVPPAMFRNVTHNRLWWALDARILWTADALRKRYGRMLVNTWLWGGAFTLRGLRPFDILIGSPWSQHKFGRALDLEPTEVTAEEIREDIRAFRRRWGNDPLFFMSDDTFKFITCIETGVPWLHCDVRNWEGSLLEVDP